MHCRQRAMMHPTRRPRGFPGAVAVAVLAVLCSSLATPSVGASAG